jgi:Protein of unknown function (DUF2851)
LTEIAAVYLGAIVLLPLWRVCEPPPEPLSEAELGWIWAGQRFPPDALATRDGHRVRVLNPGRPNSGAGPDFRDAVLEVGGEERRGDVELHVRASAFRGHGHHLDPAYDGVALHVVYRADDGASTALNSGAQAPVAAFAPWLEERSAELGRWLAAPALWSEPCKTAEQRLGTEAVAAVLQEAGLRRFKAKVSRVRAEIASRGEADALWLLLFETLGQGNDRAAFQRLALAFPPELAFELTRGLPANEARANLDSALLAVANLGPVADGLPATLPTALIPGLPRTGRPANRPERRLRAFVRLYLRAGGDFAAYALQSVERETKVCHMIAAWQIASDRDGPALLGEARARELVLNAVLPFAAARPDLHEKTLALLAQLAASAAYGKTAFLESNLKRADGKRRVSSAVEQQGLLAFLAEWCSQGGCGRCPLS